MVCQSTSRGWGGLKWGGGGVSGDQSDRVGQATTHPRHRSAIHAYLTTKAKHARPYPRQLPHGLGGVEAQEGEDARLEAGAVHAGQAHLGYSHGAATFLWEASMQAMM